MGPFKCPECGIWWAGLEHRCRLPQLTDRGNVAPAPEPNVYRPLTATTLAPWCGACRGYHIPGAGPCTGTWTEALACTGFGERGAQRITVEAA